MHTAENSHLYTDSLVPGRGVSDLPLNWKAEALDGYCCFSSSTFISGITFPGICCSWIPITKYHRRSHPHQVLTTGLQILLSLLSFKAHWRVDAQILLCCFLTSGYMAACGKLVAEERAEWAFCCLGYGFRQVTAPSFVDGRHQRRVQLVTSHKATCSCPKPASAGPWERTMHVLPHGWVWLHGDAPES